jgi:predicted AlkP superfamily phosphohydrolase/phosphomutase
MASLSLVNRDNVATLASVIKNGFWGPLAQGKPPKVFVLVKEFHQSDE